MDMEADQVPWSANREARATVQFYYEGQKPTRTDSMTPSPGQCRKETGSLWTLKVNKQARERWISQLKKRFQPPFLLNLVSDIWDNVHPVKSHVYQF